MPQNISNTIDNLCQAIKNDDFQKAKEIAYQIKDKDFITWSDHEDLPLHLASSLGHVKIVKMLLERNENNPEFDLLGDAYASYTAMHCAIQNQQIEVVEVLINHNYKLAVKSDRHKGTPLHYATKHENEKIVALLLPYASNSINQADACGRTPKQYTKLDVIIKLLDGNIDQAKAEAEEVIPNNIVHNDHLDDAGSWNSSYTRLDETYTTIVDKEFEVEYNGVVWTIEE
ncbi:MAG: ankyrin repeat domain-containing protein [Rickettsiaceae bacterium]|nr:MAG: ankyrin repeat domain-containing protein [Rickettsiaceae bacterium]